MSWAGEHWHPGNDAPLVRRAVKADLVNLMLGKKLGYGMSRHVFVHELDPTCVIKIEPDDSHHFQNVIEWRVWQSVKDTPHEKWFAPCLHIGPLGTVLVQRRVKQLVDDSQFPTKVPEFLYDLKKENYGLYEGRVVACDYGTSLNVNLLKGRLRLVKPNIYQTS